MLIKYIKSILWSVAKCLSHLEDARCLMKFLCDATDGSYIVFIMLQQYHRVFSNTPISRNPTKINLVTAQGRSSCQLFDFLKKIFWCFVMSLVAQEFVQSCGLQTKCWCNQCCCVCVWGVLHILIVCLQPQLSSMKTVGIVLYCHVLPVWLLRIFSHYLVSGMIF